MMMGRAGPGQAGVEQPAGRCTSSWTRGGSGAVRNGRPGYLCASQVVAPKKSAAGTIAR